MNNGGRGGPPPCPGLGPDGGMAEYIRVPARYLMPLDGLDPVSAAPLADAGLTPMHAINGARHRLTPGATAVVIGVGGLGHSAVQILAATTGVRIIAIDTDPAKLDLATAHGAHETLRSGEDTAQAVLDLTDAYGADAVFDFVGAQPTIDFAASVIAPDGALRIVGVAGGALQYGMGRLPWGVDARLSYGGTRRDQGDVLDLARTGHLSLEVQRYALDDGIQAFDDLEAGKVLGRAVLVP
jgi:propanol-preferring alcohol dehydrogenase